MLDAKEYKLKITTGQYQHASSEDKQTLTAMFGENFSRSFEIYFHWYNIIHELGHAIILFNLPSRPHPVDEEQLVNNFAYAYWKRFGEQEKLHDLVSIVCETLKRFANPSKNSEDHIDFAKSNWDNEEFFSFNNYAWFQFSCVNTAINIAENLDAALGKICTIAASPSKDIILKYEISEQMPVNVAEDAIQLIKSWGILLPEEIEITFCDDVNCHMCQWIKL